MTKEEALAFLELTDDAGPAEVRTRLAERLAYFTDLSENAASDFLRRLNMRHLDKVKTILQESAQWPSFTTPAEPVAAPEAVAEEEALTMHIVSSLKEAVKKKAANDPVAWLIQHTENLPAHGIDHPRARALVWHMEQRDARHLFEQHAREMRDAAQT